MFVSITTIEQKRPDGLPGKVLFGIRDTCFVTRIEVDAPARPHADNLEAVAIIKIYLKQNLNVSRNLAVYYLLLQDGEHYLNADYKTICQQYPTLGYERYYLSVKRYYEYFSLLVEKFQKNNPL